MKTRSVSWVALFGLMVTVFVWASNQGETSAFSSDWDQEKEAIYVADLSLCQPASALSQDGRPGTWKVVSFATTRVAGKMVFSAPGRPVVPELRLPLTAKGWHAIYVGVNYQYIWERPQLVKVRLASDPAFAWITREGQLGLRAGVLGKDKETKSYTDRDIVEVYWKSVNLRSGEELVIARKRFDPLRLWHASTDYSDTVANVSYVKLIPLSAPEIRETQQARGKLETKRVLAINDMGWLRWTRSREEIQEELEPLRDTDVSMMLWGTFRGFYTAYFNTKAGTVPTGGDNEFEKFFTTFGEGMDAFKRLGIDPLAEAISYAHAMGIKLVASMRMDGPKPPPYDGSPGPFFDQHPEFHCIDRDGSRMPRISLAYPQVRHTFVEMFREAVGYGADGVAVIFSRNYPFVGYDAPVVKTFREKYRFLPTQVESSDERWLGHQATYVTSFMREIREMLDAEGKKRNTKLVLTAMIRGTVEHQLDVDSWINEKLVDYLILHPWGAPTVTQEQVRKFQALTRGTKTHLYVDFYPRELPAELIRQNALKYYAAGTEGFCLWDSDGRIKRPGEWVMWSQLGHREQLHQLERQTRRYFRVVPLKSFAGYSVDGSWWHSTG